jgi:hypothetical protein
MTINDLMVNVPLVVKELGTEFYRRGEECIKADATSQQTACFLLALRSVNIFCSMGLLMKPNTRDSWDVLARAFMESRDLLITFRFDDQGIRNKVHLWFAGNKDAPWKAEHKKCERFIDEWSGGASELGRRWSMFSALSHPTVHAAKNSTSMAVTWITNRPEDFVEVMTPKVADYLTSLTSLIVATTFDHSGWVSLGCDPSRMPSIGPFLANASIITPPLLDKTKDNALPIDSFRPES